MSQNKILLAIALVTTITAGCADRDKPPEPTETVRSEANGTPPADPTATTSLTPMQRMALEVMRPVEGTTPPDFSLTVNEFYAEVGPQQAQRLPNPLPDAIKYDGKVLQLTGDARYFSTGKQSLSLGSAEGGVVHCGMQVRAPWKQAGLGQIVTVKGRAVMPEWHLELDDCIIVDVTGDPPPRLSAAELIAALADTLDGQRPALAGMPVVVTGAVKAIDRWDYGDDLVVAADDRGDVHCLFTRHPTDKSRLAEELESVVITGYVDQRPVEGAVELNWCFRIDTGEDIEDQ